MKVKINEIIIGEQRRDINQDKVAEKRWKDANAESAPAFVQDTAKKTGISTRVIHEEILSKTFRCSITTGL